MIVMLSNNTGKRVKDLWLKYPKRLGMMIAPRERPDAGFVKTDQPYALDNGRFASTTKGKPWSEEHFRDLCEKAVASDNKPLFITAPDVVGDAKKTIKEWGYWSRPNGWLKNLRFPLAFVMQDGMTVGDIPPNADWIFIGGSQKWKRANIYRICNAHPNVHVGGINSPRRLWICHKSGAKSVDGTGWCRGDKNQWIGLLQYLHRSENWLDEKQPYLFDLFESDAMGAKIDRSKTLCKW